jgi:hypothetical protein
MNTRAAQVPRVLINLFVVMVLIFISTGNIQGGVLAQDIPYDNPGSAPSDTTPPEVEVISPYFSIEHRTLADGIQIEGYIINGPPTPPAGYAHEPATVTPSIDDAILPDFPSFNWVFGCSAVSGAMIAAYYDRGAFPDMYTGPTAGGVMPLTDTSWPLWSDGFVSYPNNPLIASHNGVDGRSTKGSIDDYWVKYDSAAEDPYITGSWTQHSWGSAIGDYMKTSQSAYDNTDGSTQFWNYGSNAKLTCSEMEDALIDPPYYISDLDGTYGRKLFYEARGYTVSDCYNQNTDNNYAGGFSLIDFQAEIDAGNPVLLNLAGHSIVGYGYVGSTIYIRDTWDNIPAHTYSMTWGGSYEGMELRSVSVVHLGGASGPEMDVRGNGVSIPDGDSTPSFSDRTDFGTTHVVTGTVSHTFTIHNLGGDDLNLTGVPKVSLSGPHAADFNVTLQPSSPVTAGGSTSFTVVFSPSDTGVRTAAISIANNDDDENPYNFAIRGSGTTEPIILNAYLPMVIRAEPAPVGWQTLVNTTFEGDFPGGWDVFDNGEFPEVYYWASRPCRAYQGSNSGWAVGGGANGSSLNCGSNYPNYAESWMVYGPFSLENTTAARLDYKLWLNSEEGYDGVCRLASTDGVNFTGFCTSGYTNAWVDRTLDLADIGGTDLRGQPQVWVAIWFTSDFMIYFSEGAYVDNVVLRRCYVASCSGLNAPSLEADGSLLIERPWSGAILR